MTMQRLLAETIALGSTLLSGLGTGAYGAAAGPGFSKYCIDNGSTMLLARPASNGGLEFGMSSWNARGSYFGVLGLAQPDAGGWRFRQNMNADPTERCEALIARLPDGGYSFSLTPPAAVSRAADMAPLRRLTTESSSRRGRGRVMCRPASRWRMRCPWKPAGSAARPRAADAERSVAQTKARRIRPQSSIACSWPGTICTAISV